MREEGTYVLERKGETDVRNAFLKQRSVFAARNFQDLLTSPSFSGSENAKRPA